MNTHSAVPGLNRDHVYSLDIKIPPLPEQKAIASVLSSLDDKIELLQKQNETLEKMAEVLFHIMFIDNSFNGDKKEQLGKYITVSRGLSYKGKYLTDNINSVPMHNLNSVYEGGGYKYEGIKYYNGVLKIINR